MAPQYLQSNITKHGQMDLSWLLAQVTNSCWYYNLSPLHNFTSSFLKLKVIAVIVGLWLLNTELIALANISVDSCHSLHSSYQLQSINQKRGDKLQTSLRHFWMVLPIANYWNPVEQEEIEFRFSFWRCAVSLMWTFCLDLNSLFDSIKLTTSSLFSW